ncbi:hypothetical protein COL71_29395 [Bacillus mycoides]|nr:hypothetical protein BW891_24690 [Bacillus mycoides]PEK96295.1 hypothetical protein CN600_05110 [Bacillus mycoides]PGA03533.1 hypothetical protein COL71_29395 [Bacillus mycoides]QEL88392.1 hypothetical protein DN409_29445 [Bacillus mycoides]TXR90740.1 hypothetical protein DN408_00840 [Bacillus sp. AR13-1]
MYWVIQQVQNNTKFPLIHPVNLSKKGVSIKVFHLRNGFIDFNQSVILKLKSAQGSALRSRQY